MIQYVGVFKLNLYCHLTILFKYTKRKHTSRKQHASSPYEHFHYFSMFNWNIHSIKMCTFEVWYLRNNKKYSWQILRNTDKDKKQDMRNYRVNILGWKMGFIANSINTINNHFFILMKEIKRGMGQVWLGDMELVCIQDIELHLHT